ncbi:MAG: bifunctional folylpolyglutamate synthase/dihydrofolate synthase [Thermomicrobiales bacterium]
MSATNGGDTELLARYEAAVDYLESLLKWHTTRPAGYDPQVHLSRERMLLRRWGDPHLAYPIAHITGTSGKGSTAAMLASVLRAAGHHTGLHTSPYLQAYTEKIRLDDSYLSIPELAALVEELRVFATAMEQEGVHGPPSYFEATVAIALTAFARHKMDAAVVEVGIGGRHDSTNVVLPKVSVITNVGFDHTGILGHTLHDIAYQKAGIIKPGVPAVTAATAPDALAVIRFEAEAYGAPLTTVHVNDADAPLGAMHATIHALGPEGATFTLRHGDWHLPDARIRMLGAHQVTNAATAVAAARVLDVSGLAVPDDAIRAGLENAFFPGRLEVMQRGPGIPTVVIDGAHNPDKARSLVAALGALFPGKRVVLVLGMVADKDAEAVINVVAPAAAAIITTQAPIINRAVTPAAALAERIRARGIPAEAEPDPDAAVAAALDRAGPDDVVCVTGSLYLVGAVRRRWIATDEVAVRATSLP